MQPPAEATTDRTPGGRSAAPGLALVALTALALAALQPVDGAALGGTVGVLRALLALPLVLGGGAALGPLLFVTPTVEPSRLKVTLFSSLLAPALVAALWSIARAGLGLATTPAWSVTFVAVAALAALGARRRVGGERLGRAAGLTCVWAFCLALVGAWLVWSDAGLSARLLSPGAVAHSTLADHWLLGGGSSDPWLYGGESSLRPAVGAWLAAVAGPAGLDPMFAIGLVVAWSLALTSITAYLSCAALFHGVHDRRSGVRDLACAVAVPLAVALPGGLAFVVTFAVPPPHWLDLDPAVVLARTYALAALLAGLHATRRGARPWPGLCATLVGLAALAQPLLGAAVALALLVAGLAARRAMLAPLLLLALLPAFLQSRLVSSGLALLETSPGFATPGSWIAALAVAVLLILTALGSSSGAVKDSERAPLRRGLICVVLAAAVPTAVSMLVPAAVREVDSFGRFVLSVLALLFAAGIGGHGAALIRWPAALAFGALLVSGPFRQPLPPSTGSGAVPFVESSAGLALVTEDPLTAGLGEAFAFLRSSAYAGRADVALLRGAPRDPAATTASPPSLAPLLAGVPLWVDALEPPGWGSDPASIDALANTPTALGDTWAQRVPVLDALYHTRNTWRAHHERLLLAAIQRGTTFVCVVTELDRRRTTDRGTGPRGVDTILFRLGAEAIFDEAETSVYRLGPSR